jgi:hypothetical protein
MSDSIFSLTKAELDIFIFKSVNDAFKHYINRLEEGLTKNNDNNLKSTKEACHELKVSRQTLNNWRKIGVINEILKPHIIKLNGRVLYNIQGVKKAISDNSVLFRNLKSVT